MFRRCVTRASRSRDVEQNATRCAPAHQRDRVVYIVERELMGYDSVIINTTGFREAYQPRDVAGRLALPALRSFEHFVKVQRERVNLNLFVRNADQDAAALFRREFV